MIAITIKPRINSAGELNWVKNSVMIARSASLFWAQSSNPPKKSGKSMFIFHSIKKVFTNMNDITRTNACINDQTGKVLDFKRFMINYPANYKSTYSTNTLN